MTLTRGEQVFLSLMDLDLILQDGDKMVALKSFLASVNPSSSALDRLHTEILTFKSRIEILVEAAQPNEAPEVM